jgi:hypothetical protein
MSVIGYHQAAANNRGKVEMFREKLLMSQPTIPHQSGCFGPFVHAQAAHGARIWPALANQIGYTMHEGHDKDLSGRNAGGPNILCRIL